MTSPPGGADGRRVLGRWAIIVVVTTVVLMSILIGSAGAATASDAGSPSAVTASGGAIQTTEGLVSEAGANTSDAIQAAVAHVSDYESTDVPNAIVVANTTELVSLVREATDSDPAEIRNDTANLQITAPQVVTSVDGTRTVELHSWTRNQGLLLRWEVVVESGEVVRHRTTAVRTGLGSPVNFEGFAPPEGATVIDESLVTTAHSGGNLSVSDNIVTVYENGSAESTTISVSDFGSGGETVDITVTIAGSQISDRSGTALQISTDENGNGSVTFTPPKSLYSGRANITANSSSTTIHWNFTDRTPGNDNKTMDDERGLLTIEEARNDTATSAGATITYVAKYTDQNLDSVIDNDPNRTTTESDRQEIVDAVLRAMTNINRNQIGNMNFDEYVGQQFDQNRRVPVTINDGQWAFHGVRSTKAFGSLDGSGIHKSITYNPNIGYGNNLTRHTRHIMAHEHFHLIQYSYMFLGTDNRNSMYIEGMARFIETRADPDVVHDDRSLFFADNINGVNGYLENPDRQSLGNFSYDYAIFWLYLEKRGGINAVERALTEINNVSGSGGIDTWAPRALDRAIRRDANLRSQGIDSYREFLLEFHVDVYRATHGDNPLPFVTNKGWAEHMDPVDTEDFQVLHPPNDEVDSTVDSVGTWGVDYIQYGSERANTRAHDGLYFSLNRSDLYTRTVRLGPNSDSPVSFPHSDVARGNLTAGLIDPHSPTPNDTVYHGSTHDEVGVVVMSLGRGKKTYNLTGRSNVMVHRLNNSLNETDEEAIYLIPVNKDKPGSLTGQYGAHGDVFVSVHPSTVPSRARTGGPPDLAVNLSPVAGSYSMPAVEQLNTSERSDKTELVGTVDSSASSVWKLKITEQSSTPADPGTFFVRSNYLDGGPSDSLSADQLFGMPTDITLAPGDLQAGSTASPNQISFVVEVDNGDNRYRHSPFPRPDSSHVLVEIGGTPIAPSQMSVATLGEGQYQVTLTPPGGKFAVGPNRLCVAFTDTKFGVTETTPDNCGEKVIFPTSPPGEGSSITIDPGITTIDFLPPTPVLKTSVATADDNDTVSLVRLNNDGEGSTTAITTARVGGAESRDSLKTSIDERMGALDPAAETFDIAAGLEASFTELTEAEATDPDAPRAAILVSPGRSSSSSSDLDDVIDAYQDAGIPVHVVAAAEDPNADLLREIADRTGGTYQHPKTYMQFKTAFRQIDRLNGREEIIRHDSTQFGGPGDDKIVSRSFDVDRTVDSMVLRVDLGGNLSGNATVALFNPDGEEIGPTAIIDGIFVFRFEEPQTGRWTYEVGVDSGTEGSAVASVATHSRTSLRASTQAPSFARPKETFARPKETFAPGMKVYAPGETVRIGTSLVGPEGGLGDAVVTGNLTLPTGERRTIEFEHRGNGSYARALAMTEELSEEVLGNYTLTVTAKQREGDVQREETLAWRVRSPPFVPTVTVDDASVAPGESTTANLTLDRVPDGLSAFNATVCVNGDTGAGAIAGIDSSLALTEFEHGDRCLSFRVSDDADAIAPGAESVVLGTLTLSETVPGTATIAFDGLEPVLVDDEGAEQVVGTEGGAFSVEATTTETVRVVLEDTPNGLYRYNLTVGATGPLGPLVGISSPGRATWLDEYRITAGGIGARTVGLAAIDFENETGPGSGELTLAELTYATDGPLNASDVLENLTVSVHKLRNDNGTIDGNGPVGDPVDPNRVSISVDGPPTLEFPFATDLTDGDQVVGDGDKVVVSATVFDSETGIDTVIVNASAFGVETVTLTKEPDSDTYSGTFIVNASAGAETGSYPIRIAATDTAGNTAETTTTNTLQLATCINDAVSGSDDTIDLGEIQNAINWWAEDSEVPDTGGQTISLTEIQSLVDAWAERTTVSCPN